MKIIQVKNENVISYEIQEDDKKETKSEKEETKKGGSKK